MAVSENNLDRKIHSPYPSPCPMPLRPCALRPYSCDCSAPELWLCGNCDCGCKLNIRHLALISTGPMLFTLRLALIRLLFLLLAFLAAKVRGVRALWSVVIQASGMCHVVRGHLVMWQVASGLWSFGHTGKWKVEMAVAYDDCSDYVCGKLVATDILTY